MKALVTGSAGQVGRALIAAAPSDATVVGFDRLGLDISDHAAIFRAVEAIRPDVIVNAAAYTAVDQAESEAALAMRVNGGAVGDLAAAARSVGARLVQISTDFVFDGMRSAPYPPDAEPAPLSVYGRSKLAGERAAGHAALIVRTAWVYSATGHNFAKTMLRLLRTRDDLQVVSDQVGTPCFAPGLARAIWQLAAAKAQGVTHFTDSGVASWYDFAVAIQEEALAAGMLQRAAGIVPVRTTDFPTRAARPAYSVLDKENTWAALGYKAPHWRVQLRHMLKELADG